MVIEASKISEKKNNVAFIYLKFAKKLPLCLLKLEKIHLRLSELVKYQRRPLKLAKYRLRLTKSSVYVFVNLKIDQKCRLRLLKLFKTRKISKIMPKNKYHPCFVVIKINKKMLPSVSKTNKCGSNYQY